MSDKTNEAIAKECWQLVEEYFQDNYKAFQWFTLENPMLGGLKPCDMVEMGRAEKLLHLIKGMLSGEGP